MSVSNGSLANQTTFNNAFISRTQDSDTVAKVDLNNNAAASGSAVVNIQREHNSIASFVGKALNQAYNSTPSYANNFVIVDGQTLLAAIEALDERFAAATGHTHDGTDGNGPTLSLSSLGTGTYDLIVGSSAEVTAGTADYSSLASAITAASAGYSILVKRSYVTAESITVSKQLLITGLGYGTRINGTVTFNSSSDNSTLKDIRVSGDITLDAGADRVMCRGIMFDGDYTFIVDESVEGEILEANKP